MYELYPKKTHGAQVGKTSGWNDGFGTRYPGKMPNSKDDTDTVKLKGQKGNGGSPARECYPKQSTNRFPKLNGLPS